MKRNIRQFQCFVLTLCVASGALSACGIFGDPIVGKWRTRDDSSSIEFLKDGTVVNNQGLSGEWHKSADGYLVTFNVLGSSMNQRIELENDSIAIPNKGGIECFFHYNVNSDGQRITTQSLGIMAKEGGCKLH